MQNHIIEYSAIFFNLLFWVISALIAGLFVDQVILRLLKKLSKKTKNEVDNIIIHELKGKAIPYPVTTVRIEDKGVK